MTTLTKRVIKAAAQVVVLSAAVWYLVRTAQPHWRTLTTLPQSPEWVTLLGASAVWLASYVGLIVLWARSLRWWGAELRPRAALRIFFLGNLARYVPGAVWQFAGLAALAVEQGVSPAAMIGAVLVQQMVLLATGLILALVFAPAFLGSYAIALSPPVTAVACVAGLGALVVGFPVAVPRLQRYLERVAKRPLPLPRASLASFGAYVVASALGWVGYGTAFWLFARALLGAAAPGFVTASSAFVASYVAGLIAVFAPGGLVVREAAIVAALGPRLGSSSALLLAIGSRLWITALEILGALGVLALGTRRGGAARPQGLRSTNTN